jgi:hypothetical protein
MKLPIPVPHWIDCFVDRDVEKCVQSKKDTCNLLVKAVTLEALVFSSKISYMTPFVVCCAHLLPLEKKNGVELLPPRSLKFLYCGHFLELFVVGIHIYTLFVL